MSCEKRFDGKTVVITGAGGILCSMFAKVLAKNGAKVALLDINYSAVKKVEDEIIQSNNIAKAYEVNVLDKQNLSEAYSRIKEDFGDCDILINGAGGNNSRSTTTKEKYYKGDLDAKDIMTFFDLDSDSISFLFNLNFLGTLLPTQVFTKDMVETGKGSVINISSMNAFSPLTKIPAYSAAKAAVSNFTEWLAVHFSETGVRCNALAPGFFVTNQNKNLLFDENGKPTARTEKILKGTPMNRFGEPEELVGPLLFLLDDSSSSFINGVVLPVDGGFNAYSGV
ncbi:SDR family oxidoreductase [Clostridium amazonitimonense]|uniref:SDR family oxidoreductase n=1 Tax=Clostridium amazonitimonense TaxID=1499689 RepID=UPI0005094C9D|nr:SDR family oxidoreductase [Clostridium amazonitimonense]